MLSDLYESRLKFKNAMKFIVESVVADDNFEDEEDDELIDVESVPDDVMERIDKQLDAIVSKENYDDAELEELVDEDDEDEDEAIPIIVEESVDNLLESVVVYVE